jgi:hypothetical protein
METKFKKGDLVLVKHRVNERLFSHDEELRHGVIVDVRPFVIGGSGVSSWIGGWAFTQEDKRSEYLIVSPSGEFESWFDEKNVHEVNTV